MTLESLLFDQQDLEAVDELIEVIQTQKKAVFILGLNSKDQDFGRLIPRN